MNSAYLVIAHGSREEESNVTFFHLLEEFRKIFFHDLIVGAFLEIAKPSIPEGIEQCVRSGVSRIFVLPLMFFPGRHVQKDIPGLIREATSQYPTISFYYGGALAHHPAFVPFLSEKAKSMALFEPALRKDS